MMGSGKEKVLVTGGNGLIRVLVLRNLTDQHEFSALNPRTDEGVTITQADIADFDAI